MKACLVGEDLHFNKKCQLNQAAALLCALFPSISSIRTLMPCLVLRKRFDLNTI